MARRDRIVNTNLPTYRERTDDARRRLARALAPASDQERAIVEWLGKFDLPTLETLCLLAERAVSVARAEGYEHGWREGVEHGCAGGVL
jgi:hypothetical protein